MSTLLLVPIATLARRLRRLSGLTHHLFQLWALDLQPAQRPSAVGRLVASQVAQRGGHEVRFGHVERREAPEERWRGLEWLRRGNRWTSMEILDFFIVFHGFLTILSFFFFFVIFFVFFHGF